jgi:hypothetical protein
VETTPEVFLLHLRVRGFFGNLADLFVGSFHVGGAGSERRMLGLDANLHDSVYLASYARRAATTIER